MLLPVLWLQVGCGESRNEAAVRAQNACAGIAVIKYATFKGALPIEDRAFDELLQVLDEARPCLVEKIDDTTPASDTSDHKNLKAGDLALFFLEASDGINWVELLPATIQTDIRARGIAAYFAFVNDPKNRTWLRDQVRKHYENGFVPNTRKRKELIALRKWALEQKTSNGNGD